ncbi:GntR family transcriptional regulator [Acidisoma silvae]|uniref:GntR family transcriptional regulator n=1 Tax=Acidisoma silvae TaxID=2802396 RepID=A0A963YW57_9PROT|nr:GntR family transcriptional regulator [Acidisoma silvae]MCB8878317.1 GntR family transcriptional regulator [Acidisoma silvae]
MSGAARARPERRIPLERETTPMRIAAALRAEIAKGALLPGTRLHEIDFTAAFDVSRHTLREAISLLVAEGLLMRASFKGVEVRKLSAADVRDIYTTRRLIELTAIDVLPDAPRAVWDALLSAVDRLTNLPASVDSETMNRADLDVHLALVAVHGSTRIMNTYKAAVQEMQILLFQAYPPKDVAVGRINHEAFGRMLRAGDRSGARTQLEQRLRRSEQNLIAALS